MSRAFKYVLESNNQLIDIPPWAELQEQHWNAHLGLRPGQRSALYWDSTAGGASTLGYFLHATWCLLQLLLSENQTAALSFCACLLIITLRQLTREGYNRRWCRISLTNLSCSQKLLSRCICYFFFIIIIFFYAVLFHVHFHKHFSFFAHRHDV